ncbi:MAG: hypothetical protein KBF88_12575 [Polyangiaceae bacterium]|nr:hypothetical protein [Polyangiaceae bacterium]
MKHFRSPLFALALAAVMFPLGDARAVGTRVFEIDTLEEFAAGEAKGVSVGSDGAVRASWGLGSTSVADATAAFASLRLQDGSTLIGTSPAGKVFRVSGGSAALFADTQALAVASLVEWKGHVYAATLPDGKIFKISQGKAELFTQLPDTSHVWALAVEKGGNAMYAATGPDGKVFRIDPAGKASVHYKGDEAHIVSLALADNGDVYAGSSGKGILYRITGPGKASVLYDFPGEEVKAVVVGADKSVYAIANEYGEQPEATKRISGRAPAGPAATPRAKPGKGVLYKFLPDGKPEKMMNHGDTHYLALALGPDKRAYVGTGVEGRVYAVDDLHTVSLVADTDERQLSTLGFAGNEAWMTTSDPLTFQRTVPGASEAMWTSKALDAGLRAKLGHVSWTSSGNIEVSTRSGNTAVPDATWSPWSEAMMQPGTTTTPAARFVQLRAKWRTDTNAVLRSIKLPFVTDNMRAIVVDVSGTPKSGMKESKEGIVQSGSDSFKHDPVLKLAWKVENPDSDSLRYYVHFRKEGQNLWRDVLREGEVFTKLEYDWDTSAVSDGKYRVRVEATDELSNSPDQQLKHSLESGIVIVDNTGPIVGQLAVQGRKLSARVTDALSPIARAEVAIDGKLDWHTVSPIDNVFDTLDESMQVDLSSFLPPGSHIVALRVFDAVGNVTVREVDTL